MKASEFWKAGLVLASVALVGMCIASMDIEDTTTKQVSKKKFTHEQYSFVGATGSYMIVSPSMESLAVECGREGLNIQYQLDDMNIDCYAIGCSGIQIQIDDSELIMYAAHNWAHSGFVRSKQKWGISPLMKAGDNAEQLLSRMLNATHIGFLNPGTKMPLTFTIDDTDRTAFETVAAECGA